MYFLFRLKLLVNSLQNLSVSPVLWGVQRHILTNDPMAPSALTFGVTAIFEFQANLHSHT